MSTVQVSVDRTSRTPLHVQLAQQLEAAIQGGDLPVGSRLSNEVDLAEAYGLKGEKVKNAGDLAPALQRCLRSMRDGKAVVLDVDVAIDGAPLSQATWYQRYSIADVRKKRLNG